MFEKNQVENPELEKKFKPGDVVIATKEITMTTEKNIKPGDICTVEEVEDYEYKPEHYETTDNGQTLTVKGPKGHISREINANFFEIKEK